MSKNKDVSAIVRSAQQGNEEAWSNLVTKYSKLVWSATYGYGFLDVEREDIVQEVFIELVESIKSYDPNKASLSTFITIITKRSCIDKLRKKKVKPAEVLLPPEELAIFPSPKGDPLDTIYTRKIINSLHKAMDEELTTEERLVIKLFYLKKSSYKQIAEIMHIDLHRVKNLLYRGRVKLKPILTILIGD